MQQRKAFKFQLKPNPAQERVMGQVAGSCRYVWNRALALQKERYEAGLKRLSYVELCKELTQWRRDEKSLWLKACPSQAHQQSLKNLEMAYKGFFEKRTDFPKFKKRGRTLEGFRFPQGFEVDEAHARIYLPKIGWVCYRKSRELTGKPKNVSISVRCGKWYVSIQTEQEHERVNHPSKSAVGIDVGIKRFATLSNGEVYEALNSFRREEQLLRIHQRVLSRKESFSKNWKKQKKKISRLHHQIANRRNDFIHKISATISKNHAMIVIEDLSVTKMSQSASGNAESPGRGVQAKRGLNKAILDQGWRELRRQLEYKQAWRGGLLIVVEPQNTSRRCAECEYVAKENRKTQNQFYCVKCGHGDNADRNAARNILAAGHAVIACGGKGARGHSMKQEPTIQAARLCLVA